MVDGDMNMQGLGVCRELLVDGMRYVLEGQRKEKDFEGVYAQVGWPRKGYVVRGLCIREKRR